MKDIRNIHELVEAELIEHPSSRNSDMDLYLAICKRINPMITKLSFEDALIRRRDLGMPNPFSVSRARRKIMAERPDLRGCDAVTDERYENWKVMRAYATE